MYPKDKLIDKINFTLKRAKQGKVYAIQYRTEGSHQWLYKVNPIDSLPMLYATVSGATEDVAEAKQARTATGYVAHLYQTSQPVTAQYRIIDILTNYFPNDMNTPVVLSVISKHNDAF